MRFLLYVIATVPIQSYVLKPVERTRITGGAKRKPISEIDPICVRLTKHLINKQFVCSIERKTVPVSLAIKYEARYVFENTPLVGDKRKTACFAA